MPDAFDDQPAAEVKADTKATAKVEAPAAVPVPAPAPAGDCVALREAAARTHEAVRQLAGRHDLAKRAVEALAADVKASKAERDAAMRDRDALRVKLEWAHQELDKATAVVSAASVPTDKKPCASDCEAEAIAAFRAIEALATNA